MGPDELEKLRLEINDIDEKLIELFKKRMRIVKKIAGYKAENSMDVLDKSREEALIRMHTEGIEDQALKEEVAELLSTVIEISRKSQEKIILKNKQ